MQEPKQVLVVRKDLNMRKGKIGAQCAHASFAAVMSAGTKTIGEGKTRLITIQYQEDSDFGMWLDNRFTKIVVGVDSEEDLLDIYNAAKREGIGCVSIIKDSGLTEFRGVPTLTCCAIGPDNAAAIDKITGHLKLI